MKKIIALIGAFAMAASMAVAANAAVMDKGVSVVYDTAASSADTAVIKVYVKGYTGVSNLNIRIPVEADYVTSYGDITIDYKMTGASGRGNAVAQTELVMMTMAGAGSWGADGLLAVITCPLSETGKTASWSLEPFYAHVKDDTGTTWVVAGTATSAGTAVSGQCSFETVPARTSATVAGTTVAVDANSEAATWFKVETTGVSGATPYWYATVDGAAKKVAFTDANVEGTVTVGLVSTGSVSNAKVVWE